MTELTGGWVAAAAARWPDVAATRPGAAQHGPLLESRRVSKLPAWSLRKRVSAAAGLTRVRGGGGG